MPKIRVIAQLFIMRKKTAPILKLLIPCFKGTGKFPESSSTLLSNEIDYRHDASFEIAEKLIQLGAKVKWEKKIEVWCFATWRKSLQGEKFEML